MQICNPGFKTHSNRSKNFNAHYIRVRKDIARRLCDEGLAAQVYMLPTGVRPDALAFNRGTCLAEALSNGADFNALVTEYRKCNCYSKDGTHQTGVSFYLWDDEPISICHHVNGARIWRKRQEKKAAPKRKPDPKPASCPAYEEIARIVGECEAGKLTNIDAMAMLARLV